MKVPVDLIKMAFRKNWDHALVFFIRTKFKNINGAAKLPNLPARIRRPLQAHKLISLDKFGTYFLRSHLWLINYYGFSDRCLNIPEDTESLRALFYAAIIKETGKDYVGAAEYLGICPNRSERLFWLTQKLKHEPEFSGIGTPSDWELRTTHNNEKFTP